MKASTYDWADLKLKGQLRTYLEDWTEDGLSLDDMVYHLRANHDIQVSRETIRKWCIDLKLR